MASVQRERHGAVELLTLHRPDRLNAFDAAMARELRAAVEAAAGDDAVGAVVLTGSGRAFCAGGDVAAMREAEDKAALVRSLTGNLHPAIERLATMGKPAVAAVNGACAGGGYGLALACDLRLASPEARFKAAYLTVGLVPDGGITWLLPRIVGEARAREILLLDEGLTAERAREVGLVHRVVPRERLLDEAVSLAQRLAENPRRAAARTRELLAKSPHATLRAQLRDERRWNAASAAQPDHAEGLKAFAEKRAPRFGRGKA